jgi:hypothetical protein
MEPQNPPAPDPKEPENPVISQEIPSIEPAVSSQTPKQDKKHFILLAGLVLLLGVAAAFAVLKLGGTANPSEATATNYTPKQTVQTSAASAQ